MIMLMIYACIYYITVCEMYAYACTYVCSVQAIIYIHAVMHAYVYYVCKYTVC